MPPSRRRPTRKPPNVIAVRSRKNRQNDPATVTSHNNAYAVSKQVVTSGVSEMVQLALARVQDIAGPISLVDSPLQDAFNSLLTSLQDIDRHAQTKAAVNRLVRQLHRLWRHLCSTPSAHEGSEQSRRHDLMSQLQDTSEELTKLDNEGLGYQSVIEALAKFSTEYLTEYTLTTKMHTQRYAVESDIQLVQFRSVALDLPGTVTRHCIILVDVTGHEHRIPMEFCMSHEQLKNMLNVLFACDTEIASIQRRYLEQGKYDLCIDQGTQITELTSKTDGWASIEAGTKVVMRAVIGKIVNSDTAITCDGCGYSNFSVKSATVKRGSYWTIYCRECKRRYQISNPSLLRVDIADELANTAMMHLIRNIHVQEAFRVEEFEVSFFEFEFRFEVLFEEVRFRNSSCS